MNISVKFLYFSSSALFLLLLVAPFNYYEIKAPFFFICVMGIILTHLYQSRKKEQIGYPYPVFGMTYFYVFLGVFFIFLGIDDAAAGSLFYVGMLYVVYPIVGSFFISAINATLLNRLLSIILWSVPLISIYTILYYAIRVGIIGGSFGTSLLELDLAKNATVIDGVAGVNLVSLSTLVFAVPFMISMLLFHSEISELKIFKKPIMFLCVLLAIVAIVVSGRRSLTIVLFFTFPVSILLCFLLPDKKSLRTILNSSIFLTLVFVTLGIASVYLFGKLQINTTSYIRYLLTSFFPDETIRSVQSEILLNEWSKNPLFGTGHGVSASIIRSFDKPWRYEMSYYALLFHTGIIGFIGYSLGIVLIFKKGIELIRLGGEQAYTMIALLTGLISMLIAYSTNPYLDAIDILWVIFLPISYINNYLPLKKSLRQKSVNQRIVPQHELINRSNPKYVQ